MIRDQHGIDADWQVTGNLGHRPLNILAQSENIAALAHRDCKAYGRLAVCSEERLRRVGITAPDLRDVTETEHAAVDREIDSQHLLLGRERARHA